MKTHYHLIYFDGPGENPTDIGPVFIALTAARKEAKKQLTQMRREGARVAEIGQPLGNDKINEYFITDAEDNDQYLAIVSCGGDVIGCEKAPMKIQVTLAPAEMEMIQNLVQGRIRELAHEQTEIRRFSPADNTLQKMYREDIQRYSMLLHKLGT
jgi:biotin synthase-related radical SAM superfamily protein